MTEGEKKAKERVPAEVKISVPITIDCGQPRDTRILMFYSFETEDRLPRSGILHYHLGEGRFARPPSRPRLTDAALAFLARSGRLA